MLRLTVRITRRNLFVDISSSGQMEWTCYCYGECEKYTIVRVGDRRFEMDSSQVTVSFIENGIFSEEIAWERIYPNNGIWINFDKSNENIHSVSLTINVPSVIYKMITSNDFSKEDLIITTEYELMSEKDLLTAYADCTSSTIHFVTK